MASEMTVTLSGSESEAQFSGSNAWLRNDGAATIYAAKAAGVTAGADGVVAVPAGGSAPVYGANGRVFLTGTGSVQLIGSDYSTNPFKTSAQTGGSGVDEVARAAVNAHAGNAEIHVTAAEKAAWSAVSGENLLDNPDFRINQRGQTEYAAAGYTVDRWNINIGRVEPAANGIAITNNGTGIMRLRQNTEFGYAQIAGKPLSVSVRAGGTTYSATANVPAEKPTAAFTELAGVEIADGVSLVCNYSLADDMIFAYFGLAAGTSLTPEWVKLEVGAVTPYVPPNPADALARCQRYYQIRSTNDVAAVDLRPTMRTAPTDIAAVEGGYAYVAEL